LQVISLMDVLVRVHKEYVIQIDTFLYELPKR
jgi:hypothetical protein